MATRILRLAVALICATAAAVLPSGPAQADRIRDDQWHLRYLRVAEAHRISQGAGVTVAVIDTGVDPHPDLRNNLLKGTVTANGESGDGRQDVKGHGTGMAGLIAAHGRGSQTGALGIAPNAKILPIRSQRTSGDNDVDGLAAGIEWAVANKAHVISISAGGASSAAVVDAIKRASDADIIVVAAAGNRPQDYGVTFPALLDGVLAVGASDQNGNRADISVTGKKVGLLAPGVDIFSTSIDGNYRRGTGTSDSTAIVAGAAALVRSRYPDLSAEEVVHRLTATAVDKGAPGRDEEYGYGVLDLVAALTADVPPLAASPDATTDAASPAGETPTATAAIQGSEGESGGLGAGALLAVLGGVLLAGLVALLVLRRQRRGVSPTG